MVDTQDTTLKVDEARLNALLAKANLRKNERELEKAGYVVQELFGSEVAYINSLTQLIKQKQAVLDEYKKLKPKDLQGKVSMQEMQAIIDKLTEIRKANLQLLETLYSGDPSQWVEKIQDMQKMYTEYVSSETGKPFPKKIDDIMVKLPGSLTMQDYSIKPLQRICKYPLLFRELVKNLPQTHSMLPNAQNAAQSMEKIVTGVNEAKAMNPVKKAVDAYKQKRNIKNFRAMLVEIEKCGRPPSSVMATMVNLDLSKLKSSEHKALVEMVKKADTSKVDANKAFTDAILNKSLSDEALNLIEKQIKKISAKNKNDFQVHLLMKVAATMHEQVRTGQPMDLNVAIANVYGDTLEHGDIKKFKDAHAKLGKSFYNKLNKLRPSEKLVYSATIAEKIAKIESDFQFEFVKKMRAKEMEHAQAQTAKPVLHSPQAGASLPPARKPPTPPVVTPHRVNPTPVPPPRPATPPPPPQFKNKGAPTAPPRSIPSPGGVKPFPNPPTVPAGSTKATPGTPSPATGAGPQFRWQQTNSPNRGRALPTPTPVKPPSLKTPEVDNKTPKKKP